MALLLGDWDYELFYMRPRDDRSLSEGGQLRGIEVPSSYPPVA